MKNIFLFITKVFFGPSLAIRRTIHQSRVLTANSNALSHEPLPLQPKAV